MKFKQRSIIILLAVSAVFICVKILEPFIAENYDEAQMDYIDDSALSDERRIRLATKQAAQNRQIRRHIWYGIDPLDWMADVGNAWSLAARWVEASHIHEGFSEIGGVLREMTRREIIRADVGYKGTQLKLSLLLAGGQRVVFKPRWYNRTYVINGTPYEGLDRHNGEIAAFHLDRLMLFNRAPLVVGRIIDLKKEILPVASETLRKTFFTKGNNTCFYGKCYYCKGPQTGVCADGSLLEGAVTLWLSSTLPMQQWRHPWRRTYNPRKTSRWERDNDYCQYVRNTPPFDTGRRLLDIVDTAIFDFLIGNADRHHYDTFKDKENSIIILLDNGKSFGNPHTDEMSILAPLYQCCVIRSGTWRRIQDFDRGLGAALKDILSDDPVSPVLTDGHLNAIDRRLDTVQKTVTKCISEQSWQMVIIDDYL